MPIWKDLTGGKDAAPAAPVPPPAREPAPAPRAEAAPPQRPAVREAGGSVLAGDLAIEGTIQGSGSLRIAGRFKGDVTVQGSLTIEPGATVTGTVRAGTVVIGGQLDGNIEGAERVDLLATGVLHGNVSAGAFTVAAGSRMRGQVEFGWEERAPRAAAAPATERGAA